MSVSEEVEEGWVSKPKTAQFLPFRLPPAPPGGQLKNKDPAVQTAWPKAPSSEF
jgi:hypothetical protein